MRLLREPLLHFLLLGAGLFLLYGWVSGDRLGTTDDRIVIGPADVEQMAALWAKRWGRPPTQRELSGLVEAQVREEVLYREALALRLDQNDTIVRRRMAQKMEFFFQDLGDLVTPTREDLANYLSENPERFREPARVTLSHVYLSSARRGEDLVADAEALLEQLRTASPDGDPSGHGDPFPLAAAFAEADRAVLARSFGEDFADAVLDLEPSAWRGPVTSGYGLHLVFVHARSEPRMPELEEVEEPVRREWRSARRKQANEAAYAQLLSRYEVVIDAALPGSTAGLKGSEATR